MNDFLERIERLSPAKRAILEQALVRQSACREAEPTIPPRRPDDPPVPVVRRAAIVVLQPAQPRRFPLQSAGRRARNRAVGYGGPGSGPGLAGPAARDPADHLSEHRRPARKRRIASQGCVPVDHVDLRANGPVREERIGQLLREQSRRPFDLANGPLARTVVYRLREDQWVVLLSMHHIISDGWSMDVLLRDLAAFYLAAVCRDHRAAADCEATGAVLPRLREDAAAGLSISGEKLHAAARTPLAPLAIQYADYAVWQRRRLAGDVLRREQDYWKGVLGDDPPLMELPTDRPRPAAPSPDGAIESFQWTTDFSQRVHRLAQREGATAVRRAPGRIAGALEPVLPANRRDRGDCPWANRGRAGVGQYRRLLRQRPAAAERSVGRSDVYRPHRPAAVDDVRGPGASAASLREAGRAGQSRKPRSAVAAVPCGPDPAKHSPVASRRSAVAGRAGPGGQRDIEARPDVLLFSIAAGRLEGYVEYRTALFVPETLQAWIGALAALLESAAEDPGQPVSRLPLLRPDQRRRLLEHVFEAPRGRDRWRVARGLPVRRTPAWTLRASCGGRAGANRRAVSRPGLYLWRNRGPGQPPGPLADRAGCRTRAAGGGSPWAAVPNSSSRCSP